MKAVTDQNQHAAAPVVVRERERIVALALFDVGGAPQHQFFQDEENKYAAEDGGGDAAHAHGAFERMRQQFEKGRAEQGADGVADEHRDPSGARAQREQRRAGDRQHPAQEARGADPGQSRHDQDSIQIRLAMRPVAPSRR